MTQEGKPLPCGRRVLSTQAPPVPNPSSTAGGTEGSHLSQEWGPAVVSPLALKSKTRNARMKE